MKPHRSRHGPAAAGLVVLSLATLSPAQIRVPDHFPTIQAAVDASAAGGWILIRAGTYAEQVVISGKNLTLIGKPGAVVVPTPGPLQQTVLPYSDARPLVTVILSDVTIRGLTVDGQESSDTNPVLVGVFYLGASGSVRDCHITGCRDPGLTDGLGVVATNPDELGTGVMSFGVHHNNLDNNWESINLFGDTYPEPNLGVLRLHVSVHFNTVTGVGLTTGSFQAGILVHSDAGGTVVGNTVTDHVNELPTGFESTAIIIGLPYIPGLINGSAAQHVTAAGNTVLDNQEGIVVLASNGMHVVLNRIVGPGSTVAGSDGIAVSGLGNHFLLNRVSDAETGFALIGTDFFGGAFGVAVDTRIIANCIADTTTPIVEGTGVTGTVLKANKITP